jgi:hypothetical protein
VTFEGILGFTMTELDFSSFGASSFDHVVNSAWIEEFAKNDHSAKLAATHEHFRIATYDDVIEVVCTSWNLKIGADDAK